MNGKMRAISANDGRKLSVVDAGPVDGIPVLVLHGTPGASRLFSGWVEDAQSRGMRLISYSRPGYSGSSAQPGRKVADAAEDVAAIARELKLDRLFLWGVSGGGPHALACAALLPDLVTAAASLASIAPYRPDEFDWFAEMTESNVEEFRTALEGVEALKPYIEAGASGFLSVNSADLVALFQSMVCPADGETLAGEIGSYLVDAMRDGIQAGPDGWIDDDLAFVQPWGFEIDQIQIPVLLLHGEEDRLVPSSHWKWLAGKIPGVEARIFPVVGHLSLAERHLSEVYDWFLSK